MNNDLYKIFLVASIGPFAIGESFLRAFAGFGHRVMVTNQLRYYPIRSSLPGRAISRLTRGINQAAYNKTIIRNALRFKPDLMVVTKGVNIFPETLRTVKAALPGMRLININYDDFFSRSPSNIFPRLKTAIPLYNWIFPSKKANVEELLRIGASRVRYLPIGYDPAVHFPVAPDPGEYSRFFSEVLFIGTFTPARAGYLQSLSKYRLGVWGGHWKRGKIDSFLRRSIARSGKNRNLGGLEFLKVIASSRISLNFFRKENRDTHNHRTFELPACGAFVLSQRSEELGEFFTEGREIAVFNSIEEMKDKVRYYLKHDRQREKMARAAYHRLQEGKHTIRDRVGTILNVIEPGGCR